MNNVLLLSLMALLAGGLIAVQAATNAELSRYAGSAVGVALCLFVVGLLYLFVLAVFGATKGLSMGAVNAAPWWSFTGGLVVASYVVAITLLVPQLGVSRAIILIVFGQLAMSLVIDHFGWFNVAQQSMSVSKLAGVGLMIVGVYLAKGNSS